MRIDIRGSAMTGVKSVVALVVGAVLVTGCKCGEQTQQKLPKLEVPDSSGMGERTVIDFGSVLVGAKSTATLTLKNSGNAALDVSKLELMAPFAVETAVPLTVGASSSTDVTLSFSPIAVDQVATGTLTITSTDPSRGTLTLQLKGKGVSAVAAVNPSPIDFGEVYVGENKKVTVTLVNQGSSALEVSAATLTGAVAGVSGDLTKLAATVAPGMSVASELTFAPTAPTDADGNLELAVGAGAGGTVKVPVKGHATQSLPRVCFKRDGTGTETCTDMTSVSLMLDLGSVCDSKVSTGCGDAGITGTLYLRNEGNTPVTFSSVWTPHPYAAARCDGGSAVSDYTFSNAPTLADGGHPWSYPASTAKVPMNVADPKPWETMAVNVSYRATSRCLADTSDDARVLFTRQGEPATHTPTSLLVSFSAKSLLPQAKGVPATYSSTGAAALPFAKPFEIENQGDAPFDVTRVELWQEFAHDGGFDAGGPTGGFFFACQSDDVGPCAKFRWQGDAGDPNRLPSQTVAKKSTFTLGTLVFGPEGLGCFDAGAACPGTNYVLYGVSTTTDPYATTVISRISATAN